MFSVLWHCCTGHQEGSLVYKIIWLPQFQKVFLGRDIWVCNLTCAYCQKNICLNESQLYEKTNRPIHHSVYSCFRHVSANNNFTAPVIFLSRACHQHCCFHKLPPCCSVLCMPDYRMFKSGLSRNMQLMLETKLKLKQLKTCMLNQKHQQQQWWVWWLPEICHFVCITCHHSNLLNNSLFNKLCTWQHNMPLPPACWQYLHIYSPGGGAVPACWLFKTSATSLPLTSWPWKWCLSHVWRGLPLPV